MKFYLYAANLVDELDSNVKRLVVGWVLATDEDEAMENANADVGPDRYSPDIEWRTVDLEVREVSLHQLKTTIIVIEDNIA